MSFSKLDPRTKLGLALVALVAILVTVDPLALIIEAALLLGLLILFHDLRAWGRTLPLNLPVTLLVFAIAWVSFDLATAWALALRLLVLLSFSFLLFRRLTVEEVGAALRALHLPYTVCFIVTATLRYVPLIGRRLRAIMDAQRSRGIDLRLKPSNVLNFLALLAPLLVQSFLLADQLAMAMEARGFSRPARTQQHLKGLPPGEIALLGAAALLLIGGQIF